VIGDARNEVLTSTSKSEFKELEHVANAHNASDMTYAMFLAAILGATPLDVVPYGKKVLIVAEVVVEPGSALAEQSAGAVDAQHDLHLLGFTVGRREDFEPYPSPDARLWAGRRLVMIGTPVAIDAVARDATVRSRG
jgi:Trk K+ transport system NAD-binding subunit